LSFSRELMTAIRRTRFTSLTRASCVSGIGGALMLAQACSNPTTENRTLYRFGAVTVHATSGPGATALASTSAIFFEAYSAITPDSRTPQNYCQYSLVDTTTSTAAGTFSAGSPLSLLFGAGTATRSQTLSYDNIARRYLSPAPVSYVAGDSLRVAVPGDAAGYPAAGITVRLAEPLRPEVVTLPAKDSALTIRWNASTDTTSAIIIALKYANPATSAYANEQILCVLKDDGGEDIPYSALGPVLASPASMRSLLLTRWRTQVVLPNATSLLHIVSSVDTLVKLP
jgi:hypothetical protein